ncbi:hypothetical protein ES705_22547 [subsurface metagenome]
MKKSNTYGTVFFCLIVICCLPILALARLPPEPPPPSPYSFPYTYTKEHGTVTGGYIWWVHIDDGNTFDLRAFVYGFLSWVYIVDISFYFTPHKCSKLYLDYSDNSIFTGGSANIYAWYTTGSPDFLGSFSEGSYTIDLDPNRELVKIIFPWSESTGWLFHRYVKFDYLVAEKV